MTRPVHKNGSRGLSNTRYCSACEISGADQRISSRAESLSAVSAGCSRTHSNSSAWIVSGWSCRLGSASTNTPRSSNDEVYTKK